MAEFDKEFQHVALNDIPMMILQHHEAEEFFRRAKDQFETLYAEGAKSARVMAIAVHPYISGVPHRIKYFEKTFAYLKRAEGRSLLDGRRDPGVVPSREKG